MTGAADTVAKKRAKPGPKPSEEGPREAMIAFKCRGDFKAWMEELAEADQRSIAVVIERAVRRYAKEVGFTKEAPQR